jgi:hypothetical protein
VRKNSSHFIFALLKKIIYITSKHDEDISASFHRFSSDYEVIKLINKTQCTGTQNESFVFSVLACTESQGNPDSANSVYEFKANDIHGQEVCLDQYKGHVLIIVNVASQCGYTTRHYNEFNELYEKFAESKGNLTITISLFYK